MATKAETSLRRPTDERKVARRSSSSGKAKHKKAGKESKKRQVGNHASRDKESENDQHDHLLAADFQLSNRHKLNKQLAKMEKSKLSSGGMHCSAKVSMHDQSEQDARIEAAEAMSALASGLNLGASSAQEASGMQRPTSASSNRSSSGSDDTLVIDHDRNSPSTTGIYLQVSKDVQEDIVSSSSASKRQLTARKSPVIVSMLANGSSNHRLANQDPNRVVYTNYNMTVSNQPEVITGVSRMLNAGPTTPMVRRTHQSPVIMTSPSPTLANHLPPQSVPLHSEINKVNDKARTGHSKHMNSVHMANNINDMPALKQVEDYCPPVKRSRTIETQTGTESMETETTDTIPDLHSLSINPPSSKLPVPNIAVNRPIGSPCNQGSITNNSVQQAENTRLVVPEESHHVVSGQQHQYVPVTHNYRLVPNPNGLVQVTLSPNQENVSCRGSETMTTVPSTSYLKAQGQESEQAHAHHVGGALPGNQFERQQVRSAEVQANTKGYEPPLPLSILNLPSNSGGQERRKIDTCATTSNTDTDEFSLQTAQKHALQRLSENLARASSKERAFMLGQIQAIVTLQRHSAGLQTLGPRLEHIQSVPITTSPTPSVPVLKQQPVLTKDTQISSASSSSSDNSAVRSWHMPEEVQVEFLKKSSGGYDRNPVVNERPISCVRQTPTVEVDRGSISDLKGSVVAPKSTPSETQLYLPQTIVNKDPAQNLRTFTSQAGSPTQLHHHSVITRGDNVTLGLGEKPNGLNTTTSSFVANLVAHETIPLVSAKKHQQNLQESSGSHLPFKKRRMAEYSAEGSSVSDSSLIEGSSETFQSNAFSPAVPWPAPVASHQGSNTHSPRVPGLNDVKTALQKDEDGDIPLHIAAAQGNLPAVDRYISLMKLAGAPVDAINKDRQTPLHIAVVTNHTPITERLLKAGACVNHPNSIGQTAIHLATKGGYNKCLLSLITFNKQAQMDKKDFEGYSPLHLAVQQGHLDVIRTLLYHGAETNVQDGKSGRTPLFHAAENNQLEIVNMLLKSQAKVNVMNYSGNTAVMAASSRGFKEVVTVLMQYGADTKGTNIGDMTSKGPPVRSTTNAALRQTVSTPSPTPDSDDSSGRRIEKTSRNKNGTRKKKHERL